MFSSNILIFFIYLFFFVYLPGSLVAMKVYGKETSPLESLGLSLFCGILVNTAFSLVGRLTGSDSLTLWILAVFSFFAFFIKTKIHLKELNRKKFREGLFFLVIIVFSLIQIMVLVRGGQESSEGKGFPSVHDTMWNIAIMNQSLNHPLPFNPVYSGVILKNNHYFYPMFLSDIKKLTGLDSENLYYRFGPFLVALLFGLSVYYFSGRFTRSGSGLLIALTAGYFSGSISFILPLFFGPDFNWKGNTFFLDQPFDQIINPYSVFSLSAVLFILGLMIDRSRKKEGVDIFFTVFGAISALLLFGFKSFGGIFILASLILYYVFMTKGKIMIRGLLISGSFFIFAFLLVSDPGSSGLMWQPFWILDKLVSDSDKVPIADFVQKIDYYIQTGNLKGLGKFRLFQFGIYFFGNLGIRILGLAYLFLLALRSNNRREKRMQGLILVLSLGSLLVPVMFNLKNSPYNIIQFAIYGVLIFSLYASFATLKIISRLNKRYAGLFLFLFLSLTLPVNIKNFYGKIEFEKDIISAQLYNGAIYIRDNSLKEDVVMINPADYDLDAVFISAISERQIYFASADFARQTGIDFTGREKEVTRFFKEKEANLPEGANIKFVIYYPRKRYENHINRLIFKGGEVVFSENSVAVVKI